MEILGRAVVGGRELQVGESESVAGIGVRFPSCCDIGTEIGSMAAVREGFLTTHLWS